MAINGSRGYLTLLMFLVMALVGALYLVWRKHLVASLFFTGFAALAASLVMSFYPADHGERSGTMRAFGAVCSVEAAVNQFNAEYGKLPIASERILLSGPGGVGFLTILLGNEKDSADRQNPKGIRFLSAREAKNRRGGIQYGDIGAKVEGFFDPWGNPYVVILDVKNEGGLHFDHGSKTVDLPGKSVAVYSAGKDGKVGNTDDIKTWGN